MPTTKNSMEMENHVFQKAKSKVSSFHLLEECFSLGDRAFLYRKRFIIDILIWFFLNHASWYTHVRRNNKMHTLFINDLIQSYCLRRVSNNWVFIIRKTVQAALWYFIMHLYKQSSHCQDMFGIVSGSNTSWHNRLATLEPELHVTAVWTDSEQGSKNQPLYCSWQW
jgi:hypothetical protein